MDNLKGMPVRCQADKTMCARVLCRPSLLVKDHSDAILSYCPTTPIFRSRGEEQWSALQDVTGSKLASTPSADNSAEAQIGPYHDVGLCLLTSW
jgi:hypothetical protein